MSTTILIVDDECDLRECLKEGFESFHWNFVEAKNGLEALTAISCHTIDYVLTDIDMPVKNGIEFLKELKAINSKVQVGVMSGGGSYTEEEVLSFGASFFLPKPLPLISDIISKFLKMT